MSYLLRSVLIAASLVCAFAKTPSIPKLPITFEKNAGQLPSEVLFSARGNGYHAFFTAEEAVFSLRGETERRVVRLHPENASSSGARPSSLLEAKTNYLTAGQSLTGVSSYARITYDRLWKGIDLVYYGNGASLEFDLLVAPHASPQLARLRVDGADTLRIDADGDLVAATTAGELRWRKPSLYQERNGRRVAIPGSYRLVSSNSFGFEVGPYDRNQPLVIDPLLVYSSYIGGAVWEMVEGIAVDSTGAIYLAGETESPSFPLKNAIQQNLAGATDAFVAKLDATGKNLIFSTFYGGSAVDFGTSIALDSDNNIYLAGSTYSANLPLSQVTAGFQTQRRTSAADSFLAKFNPAGNQLLYATYLGGNGADFASKVVVDAGKFAYIVGRTDSSIDFPLTASAFQNRNNGITDTYVTKINTSQAGAASLLFSTYFGGEQIEFAADLDVDANGRVFLTGSTDSSTLQVTYPFPITATAYQPAKRGGTDGYVAVLDTTKSGAQVLAYSTYIGSTDYDFPRALALDPVRGIVMITGETSAVSTYPIVPTPIDVRHLRTNGGYDAFASVIDTTKSGTPALLYSLLLGSAGFDAGYAAVFHPSTRYFTIAGRTKGTSIPSIYPVTSDAFQSTNKGGEEVFLTTIDAFNMAAPGLIYSTFFGGVSDDLLTDLTTDSQSNLYIAGQTGLLSDQFPIKNAFQAERGFGPYDAFDGFFAKFASGCSFVLTPASSTLANSASRSGSFTVTPNDPDCYWSATANPPSTWLNLSQSGTRIKGSGGVSYSVDANTGTLPRSVSILVRDSILDTAATHVITQPGSCTFDASVSSSTFSATGGGGVITITSTAECLSSGLQATSDVSWITIGSANTQTGTITFTVGAYLGGTAPRTGTITAAGKLLSITQNHGSTITGLPFVPVTPCRVLDTRLTNGPFGGPVMAANTSRNVIIPQSACGIPANAQAYSVNVTVVPTTTLGYLSLWPAGQAQPLVSTLNSPSGKVLANAAIVPGGTNGAVSLFVTNETHVIIDINGYFPVSGTPGLSFYPVQPCRIADTRNAAGALGGPFLAAGVSRSFPVQSACAIPAAAQAYSLNATVVPRSGSLAYLTLWPSGQPQPLVSTLNSPDGSILANAALVPAGADGAVSALATNDTELILDINGYFAPAGSPGALSFQPAIPCRVVDTRNAASAFGGPFVEANSSRTFNVPQSACSIPAAAQAFSINATAIPGIKLAYLTLWPAGASRPVVSTLNAPNGGVVANAAIVPGGSNGGVSAFATDRTHLILDINGYFVP